MLIVGICLMASGLIIIITGYANAQRKTADVTDLVDAAEPVKDIEYDEVSGVYSVQGVDDVLELEVLESDLIEQKHILTDGKKQIYLTFDDGPSIYTDRILDILKKYDVKATFFVIKKTDDRSMAAYRRIIEEGHTLAMHSCTHKYSEVYKSLSSFKADVEELQNFLYETTGVWPRIYRFPGGSSNTVSKTPIRDLIDYLKEEDIVYYDWNILSGDAVKGKMLSEQAIKDNCVRNLDKFDECVILMHDSGDRKTTVDALDDIIEHIMNRGDSVFLPITDDTVPVQHRIK